MNVQPWLAESWSISDDHLTWTFKIRDNVKFSNGNLVTAEAVKNLLNVLLLKILEPKLSLNHRNEADGQNLIITTSKPQPNMPGFLADPLFIIVDVSAEKQGRDFAKEGPICTGPYKVESFVKEKAVMVRNEYYWDGEVPFERVEIPSIDDPNTRAMALQSGEVNFAVNIAAGDIDLFRIMINSISMKFLHYVQYLPVSIKKVF